jgi:hypothetical protein
MTHTQYDQLVICINNCFITEGPSGYIPRGAFTFQAPTEAGDISDDHVLYVSPDDKGMDLLLQAFEASKRMENVDDAITLTGIVGVAAHRFYNGHHRTAAVVRQLLSPSGRGYKGTDDDKEFYLNLSTDRVQYLGNQSLHPLRADLPGIFARKTTNMLARYWGYKGPDIVGVEESTVGKVRARLPEIWEDKAKEIASIILNERRFALMSVWGYLRAKYLGPANFLEQSKDGPVMSINKIAENLAPGDYDDDTLYGYTLLKKSHDMHKARLVQGIIDCIASNDDSVFGPGQNVLDQYSLGNIAKNG